MVLIIQNNTAIPRSYLSGAVSLSANSAYTVTTAQLYPISRDPVLLMDTVDNSVFLSDGTNIYSGTSATGYLNTIASSLGGAVVGYVGSASAAPSFAILVGGKDSNGNVQAGAMDTSGNLMTIGNVASGSQDSGNPVKVGAVFNDGSQPSLSTGQRSDLQANFEGDLAIQFRNKYQNVTGNSTTTVKSGRGVLHSIIIGNNTTGGVAVIYDNTAGSGTVIMNLTMGTPSGGLLSSSGQGGPFCSGPLGLEFSTGLTIVTSGSTGNNITIVYK